MVVDNSVPGDKLTVIFDLETTGFCPMPLLSPYHRVVQISALCLETGEFFDSFVYPGMEIPGWSTRGSHNITDEDVRGAPSFAEAMVKFKETFGLKGGEVTMIAHNCYQFDRVIFLKELERTGWADESVTFKFWDTLPWLRENLPNKEKKYNLGFLYQHLYKKELENAHRSDADVRALAAIYNDYIRPKVGKLCENYDGIQGDCLGSIRYVGPWRARLIVETTRCFGVAALKAYVRGKMEQEGKVWIDTWLLQGIRVRNKSHRLVIMSQIVDVPLWDKRLLDYTSNLTGSECMDHVDYYVKYRYHDKVPPASACFYSRGLMASKNKSG